MVAANPDLSNIFTSHITPTSVGICYVLMQTNYAEIRISLYMAFLFFVLNFLPLIAKLIGLIVTALRKKKEKTLLKTCVLNEKLCTLGYFTLKRFRITHWGKAKIFDWYGIY